MISEPVDGRVWQLFAELLDYPRANPAHAAADCSGLVAGRSAEAAALMREFAAFAERTPLAQLEEVYTGLFELDATCHPYIGYHLFGESYKRSAFLLALKERYRAHGIQSGVELEDHLALVLRYLAAIDSAPEVEEMTGTALHPALRKMLKNNEEEPPDPSIPKVQTQGDEYRRVLQALRLVLLTIAPDDMPAMAETPAEDLLPMAAD
ncbi:MAG: molecular chaperone TorD family protein [Anaerolineales bacterium]|nr:molecular chaperone TorD family protein [Anaerolineales bacterium]